MQAWLPAGEDGRRPLAGGVRVEGRFAGTWSALAGRLSVETRDLSVLFDRDRPEAEAELALELDRIRARNKELQLLIERERIQRFRNQQRKVLEFDVEEAEPSP